MMKITAVCVGKIKEAYFKDACREYIKRLGVFCNLNIIELSENRLSGGTINTALEEEAERIEKAIPYGAFTVFMCVEGEAVSSHELSALLERKAITGNSHICFIIGSSHGISERLKEKADKKLSFSKMTFPHSLARVLLLEQLYRAFMISSGGKYHK